MPHEITREHKERMRERARRLGLAWREPNVGGVIRAHLTESGELIYECPGCGTTHGVLVVPRAGRQVGPVWQWDGSIELPGLSPSVLIRRSIDIPRCHHFLKQGSIQFLGDCDHTLKHKTVELQAVTF